MESKCTCRLSPCTPIPGVLGQCATKHIVLSFFFLISNMIIHLAMCKTPTYVLGQKLCRFYDHYTAEILITN